MHLAVLNLTTNSTAFHDLIQSSCFGTNSAYTMKHLSRDGQCQRTGWENPHGSHEYVEIQSKCRGWSVFEYLRIPWKTTKSTSSNSDLISRSLLWNCVDCWLDLQMCASLNKRRFWPRAFCSLWLAKITRELLEVKAWGTLYPGCILPIVRLCKGQKIPENYRRYYKSSISQKTTYTYIFPVFFSCITYQHKGLDRNTTEVEICKRTSWKTPNKLLKSKWQDHAKMAYR